MPQFQVEQVGKQTVVAEPGSPRVQCDHEGPSLLQLLQNPLPTSTSGQQVSQRAAHPLKHGGPQQQPSHLIALPIKDFGEQIFGDRALAAAELGRKPFRIGVPGQ